MTRLDPRAYLGLAAVASLVMLAAAHAFERLGGYAPCLLCLRQREVYWLALVVALAGLVLLARSREPLLPRVLPLLLAAVFLTGAGVAAYHAGVEWKWFPAPTACGGVGGNVQASDIDALLRGQGGPMVRCDEAAWSFAGLSMAGWNALVSLGLAALGGLSARPQRREAPLEIARAH